VAVAPEEPDAPEVLDVDELLDEPQALSRAAAMAASAEPERTREFFTETFLLQGKGQTLTIALFRGR